MKKISIAWLGLLAAIGFGCTTGDPSMPDEGLASDQAEVKSGGVACGDLRCAVGEVCCNENCGTCVKPGDTCDMSLCDKEPECSSDAQCTLAADYCAECDCVALSIEKDQLPACGEEGIACFTDPCASKKAVCQSGQCVVE